MNKQNFNKKSNMLKLKNSEICNIKFYITNKNDNYDSKKCSQKRKICYMLPIHKVH